MKKIKSIWIIILFLVPLTSALMININVPSSFSENEYVSFEYTLTSEVNQNVRFYTYVDCPTAPLPLIVEQMVELQTGIPHTDTYTSFTITEEIEPQTCTAYVQILSPVEQRVEKTFEIVTNPSFTFDIELNKKVFVKGEDIEIDYSSSVADPGIVSKLIYPGGKEEVISLPYSLVANQIGTYTIEASASKEGYKTVSVGEQFGVIEREPVIKTVQPREAVVDREDVEVEEFLDWRIILLIVVILVIIVLIVVVGKRKRNLYKR